MLRLAALFLLALAAPLSAELVWEKPVQQFHRSPDAGNVEAHFAFKNTGQTPITIRTMRSSCGCTTPRLEKKTYAAGESGEVVATFKFGGRTGAQVKNITIITDDDQQRILQMQVWINEPLTIAPALVFWKTGDAPEAKT